MRKAAIGIGATATAGYGLASDRGPVGNAQAFPPALIPAAAAVGVLAYGEFIAGPDDEEVDDALNWQMAVNEFTRAREDELMLGETIASLSRDVQLVENKAREEAIFRVYEQGVDSGSESDATAAAEQAINSTYATVERSILTSWNVRIRRAESILETFAAGRDGSKAWYSDDYPELRQDSSFADIADSVANGFNIDTVDDHTLTTVSHTLLDGSDVEYGSAAGLGSTNVDVAFDPVQWSSLYQDAELSDSEFVDQLWFNEPDPADYETADEPLDLSYSRSKVLDASEWGSLIDDLYDAHDAMMTEVSSIVDTYYQSAADGEIDLHNALGPQHLSETAENATDYQEAAMALRSMGYPMATQVTTVSITDDDGETYERTGRLSWTAHSGNTLAVGVEHAPDTTVGSVFFAYNEDHDDGTTTGEIRELSRPFVIESAEGASEVTFEDRTLATTELTNEEVVQIFQENFEADTEARENVHDTATDGGGAGGFLDGDTSDIRTLGIVAGGAALAALLFGNN